MSTEQRAQQRLVAANPLVDVSPYVPSLDEARAFLQGIEELTVSTDTQRQLQRPVRPPQRSWRPLVVAAAVFAVILVAVGVAALVGGGGTPVPPRDNHHCHNGGPDHHRGHTPHDHRADDNERSSPRASPGWNRGHRTKVHRTR